MMGNQKMIYPYIPNSVPQLKQEMMEEIGIHRIEELFSEIPPRLQYHGKLNLPEPILDEFSIKRHIENILGKNKHCFEYTNFLGAGCAHHFVPAVCDEINGRGEFLTAYAGEFYADHGKWQALFEFCSLMAELLDMDIVSGFLYDGAQAIATSLRMASRINARDEALVPRTLDPQTIAILKNYMKGVGCTQVAIRMMDFDRNTGLIDLDDLKSKISPNTAAVLVENPGYLGQFETHAKLIGEIARENGAEFIVSTDPICLGVVAPPSQYGATIVCGDYHPLGMHMQCGGGQGGFIATNDDMKYISEYKDKMYGITETIEEGEFGFAHVLFNRTSFGSREKAKEYTGTSNALWAITSAVYLSLMGPKGMEEIGRTIMQKSQYAAKKLSQLEGVELRFNAPFFKEFLINFDRTGMTVKHINKALLKNRIFGGKDVSGEFPELGQSSLICVTETTTKEDIDKFVFFLQRIIQPRKS
jgi:glycine cleavage system P protein (glycine dehydrogenase) subunit 1